MIVWLIGLSGAGKTTLSRCVAERLRAVGQKVHVLDADEIRKGLCSDLSFTTHDRLENVRRLAHVAAMMAADGDVVLVAAMTPLAIMRDLVQSILPKVKFVFVKASVAVCVLRDTKGLYEKASRGELSDLAGVNAVFEEPSNVSFCCDTEGESAEQSSTDLLNSIESWLKDAAEISTEASARDLRRY